MATTSHLELWDALLRKLTCGDWHEQDVHPLMAGMEGMVVSMLNRFSHSVSAHAHVQLRRTIQTGNTIYFLFNLGEDATEYCASVDIEKDHWYFQHLESITIDFSTLPGVPCSGDALPDLPKQQLDWMRAEINMTERVRLFNYLAAEKSREFALDWFKDGAGFALAARAWVPYFEPRLAFIWYVAWSETHLHGNPVTVFSAGLEQSLIRFTDPLHWRLYRQTGHLSSQIGEQDYEALFDVIWQDRAQRAGWNLEIVRSAHSIELRFHHEV
ncbi:MAG: hypothetical protein M1434_02595 [Chloroflexi bacterium]|nr:hypothetical protein [Chloroflexota bacterium]